MILRVRDENGNFIPINAIKGDSAYEQAVLGGYKGTEAEFIALLNGLTSTEDAAHYSDLNNPHKVTAAQAGALPITGGTLTGKTLYFDNGNTRLSGGQDYMQMDVFDSPKDDNNRRKLVLNGNNTSLNGAVVLTVREDGVDKTYTIYGTHNKPTANDVGAVPTTYVKSSDLNTEIKKGGGCMTVCNYDSNTLNTPRSEGITSYAHGMVITNAYTSQYGTQMCMPSGDSNIYIRKYDKSGVTPWKNVLLEENALAKIGGVSHEIHDYTGSKTGYIEGTKTITFNKKPLMVFIHSTKNRGVMGFAFYGDEKMFVILSTTEKAAEFASLPLTWTETSLSWTHSSTIGSVLGLNDSSNNYACRVITQ